jgi:hypothetical protein
MYYFLEGEFKKGSNSVCSFIHDVLKQLMNPQIKNIIIFSDSAGGQNRNYTVLKFLTYVSDFYKVKITHVYPVRGHSFCECDRNFAAFSKSIKKEESIEHYNDYLKLLNNSKFTVNKGISYNYNNCFDGYFNSVSNLKISNACKIEYYSKGLVKFFENYENIPEIETNLIKSNVDIISCLNSLELDDISYISESKAKSVLRLIKFISDDVNKKFLKDYINCYSNEDS